MGKKRLQSLLTDDPLWYKDAIIYELHVRAFYDADGDGVGDFAGLTQKLDYVQQLGATAIWLLPFYPSPLKDDGYDISDYRAIHPMYGKLRDFEILLAEAHRRGIRIITELVINHTSDQHPWFSRARRAPADSRQRDFYVWSGTTKRYKDARIIFKDFEPSNWAFDPVAKAYYWHRFYSHQPDLNFDSPAVRKAIFQTMDFWLDLGVDGMRLDAVPYLYEREGTDCENLPETHAFLKDLRRHIDRKYKNRMLLAEANQWPEDAAAYFGGGDECHMNFHFPLMPRLFMALQMEDRFPIIDILQQTPEVGEVAQWALFLRNHDELTLEMVTDEERDYMYRSYAQERQARINLGIRRRLAPLLRNNRRRIELMNALLLSLPGTPVIYYGDEFGMGDNIYLGDRNGVRTPMQWSADRNAGFSRANPQSLYLPVIIDPEYHFETVNVEAHLNNSQSLLWWMKRLIGLRKRYQAFGRGSIEFLHPENRKVLAFTRSYQDQSMLVVANLSRHSQYVGLDLSKFNKLAPVEMFGRTEFPVIRRNHYMLTLGPHSFFWFALEKPRVVEVSRGGAVPTLTVPEVWRMILEEDYRHKLEHILPAYVRQRRWFASKTQAIDNIEIIEALSVAYDERIAFLLILRVQYADAEGETYLLPLDYETGAVAETLRRETPQAIIAHLVVSKEGASEEGVLFDAAYKTEFASGLLKCMRWRRRLKGMVGTGHGFATPALREIWPKGSKPPRATVSRAEQSNTSIVFGDKFILKLFRRQEEGVNPDLELGAYLSGRKRFAHTPPVAGYLEYQVGRRTPGTLGILHGYVANEGDAWKFTLDEVARFLERVATHHAQEQDAPVAAASLMDLSERDLPALEADMIGAYVQSARLLGQRTAEMHRAFASNAEDPSFSPEPFTPFYRRALFQSMRNLTGRTFQSFRARLRSLPEPVAGSAAEILALEKGIVGWFQAVLKRRVPALRIRTHGDYHLGQILYTGKDFMIIDFEGEPARSLDERRLKRSPLRDVAGMVRSFHYAAYTALHIRIESRSPTEEEARRLRQWTQVWHPWVSAQFVRAYLELARQTAFLQDMSFDDISQLLNVYRMEKAIYELGYELNSRPEWVHLPLAGIQQIWSELQAGS